MSFFNVVALFGGLALFLYGMNSMSNGLEKLSGGALEKTLEKFTSNIFKGVLLGFLVTAVIQSSSATTVLVVGLVNAGLIKLRQAIGVMMGANIGTTVTAQIIRLSSISGDNVFMQFFKPANLAPLIAIVGIVLLLFCKSNGKKVIGQIFLGFGVLFTGLMQMEVSVTPLKDSPFFMNVLETLAQFPILALAAGAIITAVLQSSSASVGILQALSSTGALTFASTYPIILGQNIGTCVTSIISSVGANRNAKRAAAVHLYFNIIGTGLFLIGMTVLHSLGVFDRIWNVALDSGGIANFHTLFNITTTLALLPFASLLEKLARLTIRDKKSDADDEDIELEILDERFLVSPAVALNQSDATLHKMAKYAMKNYHSAISLFANYDKKLLERINERENAIDRMEDNLGNYLVKLTDCALTDEDSRHVTYLLHLISEFERIGDYSINLVEQATALHSKKFTFSEKAQKELETVSSAVEEIIRMSIDTFDENNVLIARSVEPLEETIDAMTDTLKSRHIERLKNGKCTVDSGIIFLDLLVNLERISDHCSNIAVYTVGNNFGRESINHHEYIRKLHRGESAEYTQAMAHYSEKYSARI